jgi:hypothetical protein
MYPWQGEHTLAISAGSIQSWHDRAFQSVLSRQQDHFAAGTRFPVRPVGAGRHVRDNVKELL